MSRPIADEEINPGISVRKQCRLNSRLEQFFLKDIRPVTIALTSMSSTDELAPFVANQAGGERVVEEEENDRL